MALNRQRIEPPDRTPWEASSSAFKAGSTVYLAGQVGLDDEGNVTGTTVAVQAATALDNIARILAAAGGSLADIVHLTLYFADGAASAEYFEVAKRYFPSDPPPATGVVVQRLLVPSLLIEIAAIAVVET